jgi:AmmeMemoRadiSam system protein B
MPIPDSPQLRPFLAAAPEDRAGTQYVIWDQARLSDLTLRVSVFELTLVQMFDGQHTLRDIQVEAMRLASGRLIPLEAIKRLAGQLDQCLFLDGKRFRDLVSGPVRPPSCIGAYGGEPDALRRQLAGFFDGPDGPGKPRDARPDDRLRAALIPHIDYGRGGRTFAFAFKELYEHTRASLFVIVGTSHYSRHRFTLTRKHFQTPLGIAPTDQPFIDRLVKHYGDGLFDDELMAHLPEHSIELEVVFLQYLYEGKRPFRIVPLVVGPFQDCVATCRDPGKCEDIPRMVEALRAAERDAGEPVCYIISGDLAHIGPKFGDERPVHQAQLRHCKKQDEALLEHAIAIDPGAYFRLIAQEEDSRRICGLPPTWTVLEALRPAAGAVLHYDQYVHPVGLESVSFASAAFYR